MASPPVIAIDGPAGVGKSTTARYLADQLGLLYIDTGAMYRALTWAALSAQIAPQDGPRLAALLRDAKLELRPGGADARVFWDGREISTAVRKPEVEAAVSWVSAHPDVRSLMVQRQRALGRDGGVVMEGRDIGSVVFPLADAKLFLDATSEARVERRARQQHVRGQVISRNQVAAEMQRRDRLDSERQTSPLVIPPDALVLDTSALTLAEQQAEASRAVAHLLALRRPSPPAPGTPAATLRAKYRFAYRILAAWARFYGLRVVGREHLDLPGGVLVTANHISWWDPPIVGSTLQRGGVMTLTKAELFRAAPLRAFFRWLEAIPIERSRYDAGAFTQALNVLANGADIFIFPEGTRRPVGSPGPVRSGLGLLMQRSGAPAVPVFVRGTRCLQPGGSSLAPLEVRFGPAVRLHALPVLRRHFDERQVSLQVAALFESVFRELQARSYAEQPQTEWERADGERMAAILETKSARIFRNNKR